MQQAYQQLTNAYRQYNAAVKSGNEAGKAYWSQSAQNALNEILSVQQKLGTLNMEESVRRKILDLIEQARNAEAAHQATLSQTNSGYTQLSQTLDQVGDRLIQMVTTMVVLRGLTSIWRSATEYAQEFYDKLNEIRIVTGRSQSDVNRLGQGYRSLAKQMSVSSTEIAKAAVEFWRQG